MKDKFYKFIFGLAEFNLYKLAKGYSLEETIELAEFTDADIPRIEEFKRNRK